jgi:uncharacterized protein
MAWHKRIGVKNSLHNITYNKAIMDFTPASPNASSPFLTARWLNLLFVNYRISPDILRPYCPAHVELDEWNGEHYVSLVGFLFDQTRVRGVAVPFHTSFPEVNLRFYVRYKSPADTADAGSDGGQWRRGVVFVKEIVPRWAITFVANTLYGEHYTTHPMRHSFQKDDHTLRVRYEWQHQKNDRKNGGRDHEWDHLSACAEATTVAIESGSEEEFITEHYWGYTRLTPHKTSAYQVLHPRWNVHRVLDVQRDCSVRCDVRSLYGAAFAEALSAEPSSVFVADGSEVAVLQGAPILAS